MNINTTSWHYRLLKASPFCQYDMPRTVCSYVTILAVVLFLLALIIPGVLLAPAFTIFDSLTAFIKTLHPVLMLYATLSVAAGIIVWAGAALIGIIALIYYVGEKLTKWKKERNLERYGNVAGPPDPPPSLLAEWYHGLKGKYCVTIKYTDE